MKKLEEIVMDLFINKSEFMDQFNDISNRALPSYIPIVIEIEKDCMFYTRGEKMRESIIKRFLKRCISLKDENVNFDLSIAFPVWVGYIEKLICQ